MCDVELLHSLQIDVLLAVLKHFANDTWVNIYSTHIIANF